MDGLQWKTLVKWMIWRYLFFGGKQPYKCLAFASFVTSDIGSIIDFNQVCLQLFISGRFAQQSAEADSSGELGNGAMCQNAFTKRHLQKNLPTHIPEHLKSLKNSSTWTAWHFEIFCGEILVAEFPLGTASRVSMLVLEECTCYV